VATLFDKEWRVAGKYVESFDPVTYNLAPGVYYFSLIRGDQKLKRKMVLVN
jgi:hypothetical protein